MSYHYMYLITFIKATHIAFIYLISVYFVAFITNECVDTVHMSKGVE
jgi:hypothetical protein